MPTAEEASPGSRSGSPLGSDARRDRVLTTLALAFVATSLLTLVLAPLAVDRRESAIRGEIIDRYEPAVLLADSLQAALARQVLAVRSFLLTGDTAFVAELRTARRAQDAAAARLGSVVGGLPPDLADRLDDFRATAARWRADQDALLEGSLGRSEARRIYEGTAVERRLSREQALYDEALAEVSRLQAAALRQTVIAREELADSWRRSGLRSSLLALLALGSLLLVVWLRRRLEVVTEDLHTRTRQLRTSQRRLLQLAENIREVFFVGSPGLVRIDYVNSAYERLWGGSREALKRDASALFEPIDEADRGEVRRLLHENAERPFEVEFRIHDAEGVERWIHLRWDPVRDPSGPVRRTVAIAEDVSAQKTAVAELERQALHDPLTGLANRTLFMDRLRHALHRAQRSGEGIALLFMDLDDFKAVNDRLGHAEGDRLLQEVAGRLRRCVRGEDTLARLGGDEFAVLLERVDSATVAASTAKRIAEALAEPVELDGGRVKVRIDASIGIAISRASFLREADELLRAADSAMYRAKGSPRPRTYHVYDGDRDAGRADSAVTSDREADRAGSTVARDRAPEPRDS